MPKAFVTTRDGKQHTLSVDGSLTGTEAIRDKGTIHMGTYVLVVQSRAKEGRDSEYNHWYDTDHLPGLCSIPGVKSGRRFEATPIHIGQPGLPYLAIYEIEADDPTSVMAEMAKRSANGTMKSTDALDTQAVALWVYKLYEMKR